MRQAGGGFQSADEHFSLGCTVISVQHSPMTAAPSRKPTIKQVAEAAGVSIKTVSRVLNNERYISATLRARVDEAMHNLAFKPSQAARALAGRRSHQIALICDNPSPYYVYEVQAGVRERCMESHVRMIAQPYDIGAGRVLEDLRDLVDQTNPDGLILTPPITDFTEVLSDLRARRLRFVCLSPAIRAPDCSAAFIDNVAAAREMVNHLTQFGHRRIGFIAGHPSYATSAQRHAGYAQGLAQAGIAYDPDIVIEGQYDFRSGVEGAARLLALGKRPTAIFASSDDIAAGALAMLHQSGVAVPQDMSVTGFDDTALAEVVWPALTTIRQPTRAMAYAAADLLLSEGVGVEHRQIEHRLIIRASAASPLHPIR